MAGPPPSSVSDPITRLVALGRRAVTSLLAAFRRSPDERAFDLIALAACFLAASAAWRKTHDLTWPCENDLYRDMGVAQSVLDGKLGADPSYLGEHWWYNPLVPTVVALASRATFTSLHEGYATLGIYLNLFAPIAFYALGIRLFGRRAALAALVGFLFLGPIDTLSWLSATYSPWLWSQNFAQGVFYAALVVWLAALERRSLRLGLAAGTGLGLTALAHTAPAVLLSAIVVATSLAELVTLRRDRAAAKRVAFLLGCVVLVSAIVAAPFWLSVVVHYRATVRNPMPLEWIASELRFDVWRDEFWHLPPLRGKVALVGLAGLFVPGIARSRARTTILTWGAVAVSGILYGYAVERLHWRAFLPSWHFYFYLRALEGLLFGLGVASLVRGLVWAIVYAGRRLSVTPAAADRVAVALAALALFWLCAARWGAYRSRPDLVFNRSEALKFSRLSSTRLYAWVLEHTAPTDVFLSDDEPSFRAVMPAGRKLIVVPELFSNPYVDAKPRIRDSTTMYRSLDEGRWDEFLGVARKYRVRYVTLPVKKRPRFKRESAPILRRVYSNPRSAGFDVYEVQGNKL